MTQIFINYRREDSAGYAISLHDRLAAHFGAQQIFMDIDNIEPGEDFVEVINQKVGLCKVLLVLIGRNWATCTDESGKRRLDNPEDFVRLEIDAALRRKILVIPALVGGAKPLNSRDVPTELQLLCRRNAIELSDTRFYQDVERLIGTIDKVLANLPVQSANAEDKETVIIAVEEKLQADTAEHQRSKEEEAAARQLESERQQKSDQQWQEQLKQEVAKKQRQAEKQEQRLAREKKAQDEAAKEQANHFHLEPAESTPKPANQQESWKTKPLIFGYTLKLTLLIAFGWAVGWAVELDAGFAVGGTVGGLVTGYALRLAEPSFRWRQITLVAIGWAVGEAVDGAVSGALIGTVDKAVVWAFGGFVGGFVGGAVGGMVTGYALHLAEPSFRWRQITLVAVGWAVSAAVGGAVSAAVGGAFGNVVGSTVTGAVGAAVGGAVGGAVVGAIGGYNTLWHFNNARSES